MRPTIGATSGMTLLEIMVVMVILGIMASLVGVAVLDQLEEAKIKATKTQIHDFGQGLDLYKLDFGSYPSTSEGLGVLTSPPDNKKPYMKKIPKDPWSREYIYISPGVHNSDSYDFESYGPDGKDGGSDDIENWGDD